MHLGTVPIRTHPPHAPTWQGGHGGVIDLHGKKPILNNSLQSQRHQTFFSVLTQHLCTLLQQLARLLLSYLDQVARTTGDRGTTQRLRGQELPYQKRNGIKDSEDCGIIEAMKTVENKALIRFYRKDLTMSRKIKDNGY